MNPGTDKNPAQATVTNVYNHTMRPTNIYSMLDTETVLEVSILAAQFQLVSVGWSCSC
jgi:hypothetical protein